ncbi:MAG: glycoside hydrolase family 2 TIM barrel-domain containing protein [Niabella sp.]
MKWLKVNFLILLLGVFANNSRGAVVDSIRQHNLSGLSWQLWGYTPEGWRNNFDFKKVGGTFAEVRGIPAKVPGSVQQALLDKKLLPDWNTGLNSLSGEWVTNRSWIFTTTIPAEWKEPGRKALLKFKGLDGSGYVFLNGKEVGTFDNAFLSYTYDVTGLLTEEANQLAVIFSVPPAYLGQVYWTSKIKDWKPRFNYGWDWMPRIVQVGIWDDVYLEMAENDQQQISELKVWTNAAGNAETGTLKLAVEASPAALKAGTFQVRLKDNEKVLLDERVTLAQLKEGMEWANLKVRRWWPNGAGQQPLYQLEGTWYDEKGTIRQRFERTIGFKHTEWVTTEGAPGGADPWICKINGKALFLQGINWTPIRPNFADLSRLHYEQLIKKYHNLGINMIRIWGGSFPEKDWLYELCDQYGLLVQQDFPLSSSGLDNYPPEDGDQIREIAKIARSYISNRRHHVSMLMWCGGNELYHFGDTHPVGLEHPMIRQLHEIVRAEDPQRRFVPGSPSGISIWISPANIGTGNNWDVHGPWGLPLRQDDQSMNAVREYWAKADAMMFSEVGVPGAMDAALIKKYSGGLDALPATRDNPLWNRFGWWIEWDSYLKEKGLTNEKGIAAGLEAYVEWSQQRQAEGLEIAVTAVKRRFPKTGGILLWMGHDAFPCFTNNSIIDFEGNLKPAAKRLEKIWKAERIK